MKIGGRGVHVNGRDGVNAVINLATAPLEPCAELGLSLLSHTTLNAWLKRKVVDAMQLQPASGIEGELKSELIL